MLQVKHQCAKLARGMAHSDRNVFEEYYKETEYTSRRTSTP
jgi:hypothetical protein